jgi:TetR/AcrR family transcriptional regulator, transcriptional repressor for nem operon
MNYVDAIEAVTVPHPARRVKKQNTREKLVSAGLQHVLLYGWAGTGIDAVLRSCKVPKGSFYHYFASKEAYGFALLDSYQAIFMQRLNRWFVVQRLASFEDMCAGLEGFLADYTAQLQAQHYQQGCLVGALGQEVAGQHEGFRLRLLQCVGQWETVLAEALFACLQGYLPAGAASIAVGKKSSSSAPHLLQQDCQAWAVEFWTAWQGAVLRCLLVRDTSALGLVVQRLQQRVMQSLAAKSAPAKAPAKSTNKAPTKAPTKTADTMALTAVRVPRSAADKVKDKRSPTEPRLSAKKPKAIATSQSSLNF